MCEIHGTQEHPRVHAQAITQLYMYMPTILTDQYCRVRHREPAP